MSPDRSIFEIAATVPEWAADRRLLAGLRGRIEGAVRNRQISELRRMKDVGMLFADQLGLSAKRRLPPEEEAVLARRSKGIIRDYATVVRAIRQLLILEQELTGIRQPRRDPKDKADTARPEIRRRRFGGLSRAGDNLTEYYDFRPVGEAVGFIRGTLGIAPPPDDPFPAPKPEAKPEPRPAADDTAAPDPQSHPTAPPPAAPRPAPAIHAPADNFHRDLGHALVFTIFRPGRRPPRGPP